MTSYELKASQCISIINELYAIAAFIGRSLAVIGLIGMFRDKDYTSKMNWTVILSLIAVLAVNICFNAVNAFSGFGFEETTSEKYEDTVNIDTKTFNFYRGFGENRFVTCTATTNYVYYGTEFICKYKEQPLSASSWTTDFGDLEYQSILCQTQLIAYIDNGEWKTVRFKDLKNAEENQVLTTVLENLCKLQSAQAIYYAAPYLRKYDAEFFDNFEINCSNKKINISGNWILTQDYIDKLMEKVKQ